MILLRTIATLLALTASAMSAEKQAELSEAAAGRFVTLALACVRTDRRIAALHAAARRHRDAALPAVTGEHYEGGHWLGTFALYLASGAGVSSP